MNGVSKITVTEDVALVTFRRVPNDLGVLASIFTQLADAKVNLDMISQTAPQGHRIDISFTLHSSQLIEVLGLATRFQAGTRAQADGEQRKLQDRALRRGDARAVRRGLRRDRPPSPGTDAELTLISTGEVEISLLVPQSSCDEAVRALEEAFGVKAD